MWYTEQNAKRTSHASKVELIEAKLGRSLGETELIVARRIDCPRARAENRWQGAQNS